MRLGRSSRLWGTHSITGHLDSGTTSETKRATRRDFYEVPADETSVSTNSPPQARRPGILTYNDMRDATLVNDTSQASSEPTRTDPGIRSQRDPELGQAASLSSQQEMLNSRENTPHQESWRNLFRRRKSERKGYWDLLSFFRSGGDDSGIGIRSGTGSATRSEKADGGV